MKLIKLIIALGIVFALGGVFGMSIGDSSGLQTLVPQLAAVAQPDQSSADKSIEAAPMAAPVAAPAQVGVVGTLQAVGSQSLSVQTDQGMQLITIDGKAGAEQGLSAIDQLKVGDKVAVWAQTANGQVVASKIVVVPQQPERIHYVGVIASASADKLDVIGQQGEVTAFRFDETVQRLPDASYTPQAGDTVTVVAKPDPRGEGWLAVAIVKQ